MDEESHEIREKEKLNVSMLEYKKGCLERDKQCRQEIRSVQESVYLDVSTASHVTTNDDALLLPLQLVPSRDETLKLPDHILKDVSGVDRLAVSSFIHQEREITKKALEKAQFYRDLAERIQTEKREKVHELNDKIELVRNFCRNKICEGSSRAGKLVQKALLKGKGHDFWGYTFLI